MVKKLFIITGEYSGDIHASRVVKALREKKGHDDNLHVSKNADDESFTCKSCTLLVMHVNKIIKVFKKKYTEIL